MFTRPGDVPLPSSKTMSQQNVLVGLGLPHTPAFENIPSARDYTQPQRAAVPIRSRASNPFEGRPLPPHMEEDTRERQEELGQTPSTHREQRNRTSGGDQRPTEARSDGDSSRNRELPSRQRENQPSGDPDGSDDEDDENNYPHRNNNRHNQGPSNNGPPSSNPRGGGGGGNPGGGGGGNDPNRNSSYPNTDPQGNVPYGNLVATI